MSGTRFVLTATGLVLGVLLLVGCPESPTGGANDNVLNENSPANANDNAAGGANENGSGVPNVNDNESENANGSANENVAGNENDSGTGNDNTSGNANDNTSGGANDNTSGNVNGNTSGNGNDNAADNANDNSADNANDNASGNDNGGGGGGPPPGNTNDNSSAEGTEQVGCPDFDEVPLTVSPFAGSTAPDPLPDTPVTVLVGAPWGVVVDVGELGNNLGTLFLLVQLDDNDINGNTGELLDTKFIESALNFTITPLPGDAPGTFFVVATLKSADADEAGCDNVAQVYNLEVPITFENP
ncbi:MAG: hypothetical protein IH988_03475 [Planctomycetes bacterium]|nr:hypothetical protein [Planctomycetota bacterium]